MAGESRYLSFMGMRMHYTITQPEGPLKHRVLLLCSPLMSTFHWRKLVPELTQQGCLTVVADLPGFGRSDCTHEVPQQNDLRANMIWGILDEVDLITEAPMSLWHLAGHSISCATILNMANLYPDSTKSQIYISPLFSIAPARQNTPQVQQWFDATVRSPKRFRSMVEHYSAYPMDDYIVDRMRMPLLRPGARDNFQRMLRSAAAPPQAGLDFCPTIALWGGRDPLIDRSALKMIEKLIPDAETHVLKTAGHFPMETHSRAMRDYLRGWIRYNE